MDSSIPLRQSLASQLVLYLEDSIRKGEWDDYLPGERYLCERYHVSRTTVRRSLEILASRGLIIAVPRKGHRIQTVPGKSEIQTVPHRVALLSPVPREAFRPWQFAWITLLEERLHADGCSFEIIRNRQLYQTGSTRNLTSWLKGHKSKIWILLQAEKQLQQRFAEAGIPTVVCGTAFEAVGLSSVDVDHFALCRHAAGRLLAAGHKSIVFFSEDRDTAGENASRKGFLDAVENSGRTDLFARIVKCQSDPRLVFTELRNVFNYRRPPTGMLVGNPFHCLTLFSLLHERDLRVPHDVSIISRYNEPFLDFVRPRPSSYEVEPRQFAKAVHDAVSALLRKEVRQGSRLLLPNSIDGESVAERST